MASTASSSTAGASSSSTPEQRPQAAPLPLKRGEFGYSETQQALEDDTPTVPEPALLQDRHPADRDAPTPVPDNNTLSQQQSPPTTDAPSSNSLRKHRKFWKSRTPPSYAGIRLPTILALLSQIILVAATIAIWGLAVTILMRPNNDESDAKPKEGNTSSIFVHVVFAVGVLGQLLFLERRVYRVRAERYAYLHPGEILPTSRGRAMVGSNMAYAPWHRPPLPTYAAALAQSGVGTGDVEDHIIAQPPPPAYGHTRGSTLLLAGFLRDSLRAQRPTSAATNRTGISHMSRPASYRSTDDQWEEIEDAERARRLEETLARLSSRPS